MPGKSGLLAAAMSVGMIVVPRGMAQESPPSPPATVATEALPLTTAAERLEPAEEERGRRFEDPIETDRDSFTPSTKTAGKNRLIVESSYSFIDNRRVAETHSFPELLLRYGATERIELRLGWNYEVGAGGNTVSGNESAEGVEGGGSGLKKETQLLYGVKLLVTKQERDSWLPASSAILQGHTPTSGEDPATAFQAAYVWGWELPNRWLFDSAIRYSVDSEHGDRFATWAPSTVLKVPIGERLSVHAEYFGIFTQDKAENSVHHFFSPGVHYLVTENLEIGVRVGWGLNDQSARFFSNAGVGWRF